MSEPNFQNQTTTLLFCKYYKYTNIRMSLMWNSVVFYNLTIVHFSHSIFPFLFVHTRNVTTIEPFRTISPILEIFELLTIVFLLCTVWLLARAVRKSFTFHYNLRTLLYWYIVQSYCSTVSRLIMFLYQTGMVDTTGSFWTDAPIVIFGFLRFYCVQQTLLLLPFMFIERLFATIFRKNYEHTERKMVSVVLLVLQCVLSIIGTVAVMYELHDNYQLTTCVYFLVCFSFSSCSVLLIFILYYWNLCLLRVSLSSSLNERHRDKIFSYSSCLAIRFQLRENIRAFKMMFVQIISSAVMICLCTTLAVLGMITLTEDMYWSQVTLQMLEISISWFYVITYASALATIPSWRNSIRTELCTIFGIKMEPVTITIPQPSTEQQRAMYFAMYNSAWK